jgi:hypothetical protein
MVSIPPERVVWGLKTGFGLFVRDQLLQAGSIGRRCDEGFAQVPLPLGRFFGQDVLFESLGTKYFPRAGDFEPFF